MRKVLAVGIEISGRVGAAKLNVVDVRDGKVCLFERFCIKASAAEVIVAAVLTVYCVVAMGNVDSFAVAAGDIFTIFNKEPVFV